MPQIVVPINELRNTASQLSNMQHQADDALRTMSQHMAQLSGEWEGLAEQDFYVLFEERVPPMRSRLEEIITRLSKDLRRIADAFETTDREVI